MKNSILETDNLYLMNVSIDLINDYLKMVNDKDIQMLISNKERTYTYEDEEVWVKNKLINNEEVYSIMEKGTDSFVGNVELMDITEHDCELGICITKEQQNKHYGTEVMKKIMEYSKEDLRLKEMRLIVFSNNERAIHCYEKLGFKEFKKEVNVKEVNGVMVDDIYMKKTL